MIGLLRFVLAVLASPFKSKLRPEAENAALRHQLIVLRELVLGAYNGGGMYVGPWAGPLRADGRGDGQGLDMSDQHGA